MARAWCLKGSCSGEAGDFTAAAASFKHAHQLAEDTDDGPLLLVVLANRAICEIWRGDVKAAATRSRRAFISAEAEGGSEMILVAHCIRWVRDRLSFYKCKHNTSRDYCSINGHWPSSRNANHKLYQNMPCAATGGRISVGGHSEPHLRIAL